MQRIGNVKLFEMWSCEMSTSFEQEGHPKAVDFQVAFRWHDRRRRKARFPFQRKGEAVSHMLRHDVKAPHAYLGLQHRLMTCIISLHAADRYLSRVLGASSCCVWRRIWERGWSRGLEEAFCDALTFLDRLYRVWVFFVPGFVRYEEAEVLGGLKKPGVRFRKFHL